MIPRDSDLGGTKDPRYPDPKGAGDPGVAVDPLIGVIARLDPDTSTPSPGPGSTFVVNEWIYFQCDAEIMAAQWDGSRLTNVLRGLFGTVVSAHDSGADWREVVPVVSSDPAGCPERAHARFSAGDRPEEILLQLLISGFGAQSPYNTLPDGWGAGIDPSRIDIASFETIRDAVHSSDHLSAVVPEEQQLASFMSEQLLKPFGLYLFTSAADFVTLGHLSGAPPSPGLRTIDPASIVGQVQWSSGFARCAGGYRMEGDLSEREGLDATPGTAMWDVFADTFKRYGGLPTVTHRSAFLHAGRGLLDPLGTYRTMGRLFEARRAYIGSRFSRPPPSVTLTMLYVGFDLMPGQLVQLSLPEAPSLTGAGRGYSGAAEVVSRKIDERQATVSLELLLVGWQLGRYGRVSQSGRLLNSSGSTVATLGWNYSGAGADAPFFLPGDAVTFVASDFAPLGSAVVQSVAGDDVTLNAAVPGGTYFLLAGDWGSQPSGQRARLGAAFGEPNATTGVEQLSDGTLAFTYQGG